MMEANYYKEVAIDYENEASTTDGAIKQACYAQADLYWYLYEVAQENPEMDEHEAIAQYNKENAGE